MVEDKVMDLEHFNRMIQIVSLNESISVASCDPKEDMMFLSNLAFEIYIKIKEDK